MSEPQYLSPAEVCELVPGMTVGTLKALRSRGKGPAHYKPTGSRGKVTLYAHDEVLAWIAESRVGTRDQG
ncbi:hypothetical protein QE411_002850 [Microbacterium arborescens]|nr:hypothetical protein [Microbacterium arborescens]